MSFISNTWTMFNRYVTKLLRNPTLLVTNLLTPVGFLVLFSQMLNKLGMFPGTGGSFVSYLTPGIFMMCSMMFGSFAGISIVNDLNSGFLQKILTTPANRGAVLMGRLLTDAMMVVVACLPVLAAAALLGVSFATGIPGILLIFALAAFFEIGWSGIFLAVGMKTRSPETVSAAVSGLVFILLFISSAVFPTSIMPGWAVTFSNWNPVTYVATPLRGLVQSGYNWSEIAEAFAVCFAITAVAISAALYQFRRIIR